MRESFILYTNQKEIIDRLTDEQAGKIIKAIYQYEETGEMPELDETLSLVVIPFKTVLDKNEEKWNKIKAKRSEAGQKGMETRWKNSKEKQTKFIPPTPEEVKAYVVEKKLNVNADKFYQYFEEGGWKDSKGNQVKNWKQKILTWNKYADKSNEKETKYEYEKIDQSLDFLYE